MLKQVLDSRVFYLIGEFGKDFPNDWYVDGGDRKLVVTLASLGSSTTPSLLYIVGAMKIVLANRCGQK